MPARSLESLVEKCLGELMKKILVLTAEKELLQEAVEKQREAIAAHHCDGPPIKES